MLLYRGAEWRRIAPIMMLGVIMCYLSVEPASAVRKVKPVVIAEQLLWLSNEESIGDINTFRIPLLSRTPKGHLIAMAEAHKESLSDTGPKFLALRRSEDKGFTWTPTDFMHDTGSFFDGANFGTITVDDEKSIMFLTTTVCPHYHLCDVASVIMYKSFDDGLTWSNPVNISEQVGTKMFAPGPGYGIQKKFAPYKGRLVTCGHSTIAANGIFCLVSDDHGEKWRYAGSVLSIPYGDSKITGDFDPDENQVVELSDGSLLVNARNQNRYHCHCRIIARSYDGGESFSLSNLTLDAALIEPVCDGSTLLHNGVMYFLNPASTSARVNMTLKWSYDEGKTWSGELVIWPGPSAYSALMAINSSNSVYDASHIYIAYEKGVKAAYEEISVGVVSLYGDI